MRDVRHDLDIGTITSIPNSAKGIATRCRIAELLGVEIKSVNKFKEKAGLIIDRTKK